MSAIRLELVKLCYAHGKEARHIIETAAALETWISEGDKAEKPRPTLTAGKTATADAGAKR